MAKGKITRLANTFGSTWGLVRADGGLREVFFNLESLVDPADFSRLDQGDAVEFDEEPERLHGMHAKRMRRLGPGQPNESAVAPPLAQAGASPEIA